MIPIARSDGLTVRQVNDDSVVFDERTFCAHSLNPTAALVWRHCDGAHGLPELAAVVARDLRIDQDAASALAELAIEQLSRRGLLQSDRERLAADRRIARRQMLKQLVMASIAIPVIMSITAPHVSAQSSSPGSCDGFGSPCVTNAQCCPGLVCLAPNGASPFNKFCLR